MFTDQDVAQIKAKGLSVDDLNRQIDFFKSGFDFLPIARAAVIGDGIVSLALSTAVRLAESYDIMLESGVSVLKFVPASGAATRMFKELFAYVEGDRSPQTLGVVDTVFNNINKFAFYPDLVELGVDMTDCQAVMEAVVGGGGAVDDGVDGEKRGLNYGQMPKGLLLFHTYDLSGEGAAGIIGGRTALEEHLVEAALYGATSSSENSHKKIARIHFTVSPEHRAGFMERVAEVAHVYGARYDVQYDITYSEQKGTTDIVAVDLDNQPFRERDGKLLFRPAGHGALIDNLDELPFDLIYIKTIDNVVPDHLKGDTVLYKKALGAMAYSLREQVFSYISQIDQGVASAEEIIEFLDNNIGYRLGHATSFEGLRQILDRPLRVCGMVRNDGEPGGGPFWVDMPDGSQSLQIAESSQIAPTQRELMALATHFNPVDLVCSPCRHDGSRFSLKEYVDPTTGFISTKSKDGRELKAQELPGLWNGAMANWNTVFVEVPITTFAPVKSIVDLLRAQHQ